MALRALAEVNLAAIDRNVARLKSEIGEAMLCAVVKADAYGHGAAAVARSVLDAGAGCLAVATAAEALALREAGIADAPILVLGALGDEELGMAIGARAEVVAWEPGFVAAVAAAARGAGAAGAAAPEGSEGSAGADRAGSPVRVHVKLDSGMGRLGTRDVAQAMAVAAAIDAAPGLELVGLTTHFATSDGDLDFARTQLAAFAPFVAAVNRPGVTVHAANSGATLRLGASHFDMVRCGIALYGADPANEDPAPLGLEPALALRSYVAAVKPVAPGESAGYGRRFIAARPGWLATVPIGYGDGVDRRLSNNGDVLIGGRRYPIVGTVSMDNLTVDLDPGASGAAPEVAVGDAVTVIGPDGAERQTAEDLARRIGTINYEVLCGISPRVPRRYVRDGVAV